MENKTYKILILPKGRVAAVGLTINEAAAWICSYNKIMKDQPLSAVIINERYDDERE